jgi:hypothetical protein
MAIWDFYGHLVFYCHLGFSWPFGKYYDNLVCFVVIWYI